MYLLAPDEPHKGETGPCRAIKLSMLRNNRKKISAFSKLLRGSSSQTLKKTLYIYIYIYTCINNSKNTEIKTKLKALQTVSPIKGIIRGI